MPKKLYGTPVEDERNDIIKQLQPPAATPNPLGGALVDARLPEQVRPTTPLIDYSKVPDLNKIATANNQAITNANNGPSVAGQNGRPDTGSLNTQGPAMSREAANDSYANFEDFFNKNTGYAAKYRSRVRNHLGGPSAIENTLPGSVARMGTTENGNFGATQAAGFGGPPPPQTPNQTPTASTPEPAKPDSGNPFTSGGGQNSFTQRSPNPPAQASTAGASGGRGTNQGPGGTQLSQIKQAVEDPPTTPKATTPSTPLTDIQKTADAGNPFTRAGGTQWNAPTPSAAPAPDPQRDALLQELSNLPTGRTAAEDAEVRRLSHAEDDVASLGLDGGQDLLSELNNQPVDPMDAAFMNVAGGRDDLDKYKKTFEGATGRAEKALSDKYGAVQKRRDALLAELGRRKTEADTAPQPTAQGPGATPPPLGTSGSHLREKYPTWDAFMQGDGNVMGDNTVKTALHQVGTDLSPVDWLLVEAGKNGTNTPVPMQIFRDVFASGFVGDVSELNNRVAFRHIIDEFGDDTGRWLWDSLTPKDWDELKGSQNYGYTIHLMQKKMKAAFGEDGYNKLKTKRWKVAPGGQLVPVEKKVDTTAAATAGTMSDEDIELTLAKGNAYKDPGTGRVFKSLDEWYKFKRGEG